MLLEAMLTRKNAWPFALLAAFIAAYIWPTPSARVSRAACERGGPSSQAPLPATEEDGGELLVLRSAAPATRAPQATAEAAPVIAAPALASSASSVQKPCNEAELMSEMRALGEENSELAIELGREGNARFPNSAAAPERARRVVKSLVNLGRFQEARDEARHMLAQYPGSPWSLEVERHLLVNPLDYPPREEQPVAVSGPAP